MAKETSCFPKKIISSELVWSENQKSWISSETKDTGNNLKEDKSEVEIQQKTNLLCLYCYLYKVLNLALEISNVFDRVAYKIEILKLEIWKFSPKYSNFSYFGALIFQEFKFLSTINTTLKLHDPKKL